MWVVTTASKALPNLYSNPDPHTQEWSYAEEVTWVHHLP